MTLKDKMRTYNFWISLVSAIVLLMRVIGNTYGFSVDSGLIMDLTTGVCGIFVILGIISAPQKNTINKGDTIIENTNQTTIAPNLVSYNDTFLEMEEKLQKNIQNIENSTQNAINCENIDVIVTDDNVDNNVVIFEENAIEGVDCCKGNIFTETQSVDSPVEDIVEADSVANNVDVVNQVVEANESIVINNETIISELDSKQENNIVENNDDELKKILSTLSENDIKKLKTMI